MHILQFHFALIVFAASDLWLWWIWCQHQHKLLEARNSCSGGWNSQCPNLCHLVAIIACLKGLAEQDTHWPLGCCFSQPLLLNVNENDSLSSYKKQKERCPSGNWKLGRPASPELAWMCSGSPFLVWLPCNLVWGAQLSAPSRTGESP